MSSSAGGVKRDGSTIRESIMRGLLRPFESCDSSAAGCVTFKQFKKCVRDLCGIDSHSVGKFDVPSDLELRRLAEFFESHTHTLHTASIKSLSKPRMSKKLERALKRVDVDQYLNRHDSYDFITRDLSVASRYQYLDEDSSDDSDDDSDSEEEEEVPLIVNYVAFSDVLLTALVEERKAVKEREMRKQQVCSSSAASWLLKECELLEDLIGQLMAMEPRRRRKVLMKLGHSLVSLEQEAYPNDEHKGRQGSDVDGFTILKLLTEAGFSFERMTRVQLLRSVEELGGVMNFGELIGILFKSCFHWSDDERSIVAKLLTAMGPTVVDRRYWLAKFKHRLSEVVEGSRSKGVPAADRSRGKNKEKVLGMQDPRITRIDNDPYQISPSYTIAPSDFLRCLKDCGVFLDVAEEAALLDCLDAEYTILLAAELKAHPGKDAVPHPDRLQPHVLHYKSFLLLCSRHVGHWSDSFPELREYLRRLVTAVDHPLQHILELGELFRTFGEGEGKEPHAISERGFIISCCRSRLLSDSPQDLLKRLANVLVQESDATGGRINYVQFLLYLEVLSAVSPPEVAEDQSDTVATVMLAAIVDAKGTIRPLRAWLCEKVDINLKAISERELLAMLRHFRVPHRPSDLLELLQDVHRIRALELHNSGTQPLSPSMELSDRLEASATDIIRYVNHLRGDLWKSLLQRLPSKIYRFISSGVFSARPKDVNPDSTITHRDSSSVLRAARVITAKLRGFSQDGSVDIDIFLRVLQSSGILLSGEDADLLADGTDAHPAGQRVRYTVITEAVLHYLGREAKETNIIEKWMDALRNKLRNNADASKRELEDVLNDLRSALKGFDTESIGIISKESFRVALQTLNLAGYEDVYRLMSKDEFIAYGPVLEYLSRSSSSSTVIEHEPLTSSPDRKEFDSKADTSPTLPAGVLDLLNKLKASVIAALKSPDKDKIWNHLLEVFCVYDVDESYLISPQDFSKGIAVLLTKGSASSKVAWEEVLEYYSSMSKLRKVDYLVFCEDLVKACLADRPMPSIPKKSTSKGAQGSPKKPSATFARGAGSSASISRDKRLKLLKTY